LACVPCAPSHTCGAPTFSAGTGPASASSITHADASTAPWPGCASIAMDAAAVSYLRRCVLARRKRSSVSTLSISPSELEGPHLGLILDAAEARVARLEAARLLRRGGFHRILPTPMPSAIARLAPLVRDKARARLAAALAAHAAALFCESRRARARQGLGVGVSHPEGKCRDRVY